MQVCLIGADLKSPLTNELMNLFFREVVNS
jgi:hypothetical protein